MDSLDKIKVEVNKYMSKEIVDKTFVIRAKELEHKILNLLILSKLLVVIC